MKAKTIRKGVPVFIKHKGILQGSVLDSDPFMYNKRLVVRIVGFGHMLIPVGRVEVMRYGR